jgi:Lar family restriction alleviation protein
MADTKLKLCPFCGGEGVLDSKPHGGGGEHAHFVRCISCGCEGPWMKTEGNAIRFWNMRTPEPAMVEPHKVSLDHPTNENDPMNRFGRTRKVRPENIQPEWLQKMVVGISDPRKFVCMLEGERFAIVKSPGGRWGDNSGTHYGAVEYMIVDKQHPQANSIGQGIMRAGISLKNGGRINKTHKDLFKKLVALTDRDVMLAMLKENGY